MKKLDEQIFAVQGYIKGEEYFGKKARSETDEDGNKTFFTEPKRVNKWVYTNNDKDWFLEIKYGNRVLQLAKGKTAIVVGALKNMVAVIEQVKAAVEANVIEEVISGKR